MASASLPEPPKSGLQRTITGSKMNLTELEGLINGADCRDRDGDSSSVASLSHTGSRRSNVIQVVPGKKNIRNALRAALTESEYDEPEVPPTSEFEKMRLEEAGSEPKRPSLEHGSRVHHPSEPLEGAGAARSVYTESSAPPEGAGGYQTGQFVPPIIAEQVVPVRRTQEPVSQGLHRTITGSSVRLDELNKLVEKAGESDAPKSPCSFSARSPHSHSGLSLASGSRNSSIVQIQPGVKDIRAALLSALEESADQSGTQSPSEGGVAERQSLGSLSGLNTPSGGSGPNPFAPGGGGGAGASLPHRPRSIRRLMSEKSLTMDTVYSGMLLDSDLPSEPLEGTGVVSGRKYSEPRHGPQHVPESPKDFPRVVNGVLTTSSGGGGNEGYDSDRASVPPSPNLALRRSGPHRTISGSQMDLSELASIHEKALIPKHERSSFEDSRSSAGGSTTTHRTIKGKGPAGSHNASQVFGEEIADEPKTTFGRKAASISQEEIAALIKRASVPRIEIDSPRSMSSTSISNEA